MKEKRNMLLTLLGLGVSGLGTNLYTFAISYYILALTGSATSFALSLVVSVLPRIILSPIVGNLADRMNRKTLVILSDLFSGIVMFVLYYVTIGNSLSITYIYVGSFFLSVFQVFLSTSFSASFAAIVSDKYLTKLNSYTQVIDSIIQIGAPVFGGLIYGILDIRVFLLINGVSFILSSFTELFIDFKFNSKLDHTESPQNSFIENFVEGFRYVKSEKMYLSMAVYSLVINFFMSSFAVILPFTLITIHGFGPRTIGFIQAAFPVGVLLASIYIGSKNMQFTKALFARGIVIMALMLSIFAIPSLPMVELGRFTSVFYGLTFIILAGVAMTINIPLGVKLQSSVDEAYRGRFFGFLGSMSQGVMPLSYILVGFLIGFVPTYVILFVSTLALLIITSHIRRNETLDGNTKEEKVMESVQVITE